jgi:hypothetical protein
MMLNESLLIWDGSHIFNVALRYLWFISIFCFQEDIEKIDLADPDLNKAATKIQASFRGHKVRKDVTN